MPTYDYAANPRPLTQAELDDLAAQQRAIGGVVPAGGYTAVPPATIGAVRTTMPTEGAPIPPPPEQYVDYTVSGGGENPSPTPGGPPAPSSALGAVQTTVPPPPPPPPNPSTLYGGYDPTAPTLQGIVATSYPNTGRPSRIDVLGPTWKRQQRLGEGVDAWFAHPTEHAPASAYDPLDPALTDDRDRAIGRRVPTTDLISPRRLPVSGSGWETSPRIPDLSAQPRPDTTFLDWLTAVLGVAGVGPGRSPLQNDLGRPLIGGGPPRSG